MAESTLLFEHSLRESSSPILACSIDKSSGNFITYDESAVRLWSMKRMIKSTRIDRNPEHTFLDLLCVDKIEKVLVVFTVKQSSPEKGGIIHILSLNLAHVQTVNLQYNPIYRISWSPSLEEVIFVDIDQKIHSMHIEYLLAEHTGSATQNKGKATAHDMYHPKKVKAPPCLKLHSVPSVDSQKFHVINVLMVNDNLFAVLGTRTIRLYSRPQLVYVAPAAPVTAAVVGTTPAKPPKKKWMSKKDKAAAAAAALLEEATPDVSANTSIASAEPEPPKFNGFTLCGTLNIFQGCDSFDCDAKEPTVLRLLAKDKLLVGFDDGSAQIIYSPELLDPAAVRAAKLYDSQTLAGDKHSNDKGKGIGKDKEGSKEGTAVEIGPPKGTMAAVLCEFQAHFVAERGYRDGTEAFRANSSPVRLDSGARGGDGEPDTATGENAAEKPFKRSSFGVRTALVCPWAACSGGPGQGYQLELLTVGSDRRIAHWGVRFRTGRSDVVLESHVASHAPRASTAKTDASSCDGNGESLEPMEFEDSTAQGSPYGSFPRPRSRSAYEVPMEADLLGEYQLPQEAPTKIQQSHGATVSRFLLSAFELALLKSPVCKKVLCVTGGMLVFFDALQPHRIIVGRKDPEAEKTALGVGIGTVTKTVRASRNDVSALEVHRMIVGSAKGPMLAQVLNRLDGGFQDAARSGASVDSTSDPQSTVLVLREEGIELVLVQTGQLLQYFSTANLHEAVLAESAGTAMVETGSPTRKGMGRHGHTALATSLVRNSSFNQREVRAAEGKPTCVHWCPITHLVLVGYNTGGVGMLAPTGVVHSTFASVPVVHLQSGTQHGAEIARIITVQHMLHLKPTGGTAQTRSVVVALVGDANGVISLWQLFPAMTSKASPLLSSCQAHTGRIVYMHSCLMDENANHRLIVTACSSGAVKVWKLENHGAITLTAFFQADLNGAKLTAALAVPCAYYETIEQEDDTVTIKSAMSVVSAQHTHLVASLHHEIFCIIGLSNGVVESWLVTDHKVRSKTTALGRFQDQTSAITQIVRPPNPASVLVSLRNHAESVFALADHNAPIGCFSEDGKCSVVRMNEEGLFKHTSYFMLPAPVNSAICHFTPQKGEVGGVTEVPSVIGSGLKAESLAGSAVTAGSTVMPPNVELNLTPPVLECTVFSDFKVYHIVPVTTSYIPPLWHRPFRDSPLVLHLRNFGPLGASKYLKQTLELISSPSRTRGGSPKQTRGRTGSPTSRHRSLNDSFETGSFALEGASNDESAAMIGYIDQYEIPGGLQSAADDQEVADAVAMQRMAEQRAQEENPLAQESMSTLQSQSVQEDRRHYVGSMESMQRIVSAELHCAKKDGRLLELFVQHEPAADGTVSPETTVEIVFSWLNAPTIARENIWELFRLLEIQSTDRLRFVEVAKIAAVVTSAMHRSAAQRPNAKTTPYAQMKSYTTRVTYNAMGEKSVERIPLTKGTHEGIYKGFASTIRKIWKQQPPKVITQAEVISLAPQPMPVTLTHLPKAFARILPKGTAMPTSWRSDMPHWFHPLRVVRIARTLLDMRSAKQHEVFLGSALFQSRAADVTPLPEILVNYFERNFGEAGNMMNLAKHKIVHFLEALCQYKHHPIVNVLQCMMRLDPLQEADQPVAAETAIWLCVEARSSLCSRGCVVNGELVQPFGEEGFGNTRDGAALQVRWQYVPKADVLLVADEMLRERGKFGPATYEAVLRIISEIPSVDSYTSADGQVHKTDIAAPMVDLERFLEVLYHEYLRFDRLNRQYEADVFGDAAMTSAVSAQTRDIGRGRRKLILDDHISTFGPYHDANLRKIRSWLLDFEPFDPLRTGLVSQEVLAKSVQQRAEVIDFLGANNTPADVYKLVSFCKSRFIANDPDGKVSYIDLFALLCAWEWQTQGNEEFLLSNLNTSLPGIHRSVETPFAESLLRYFMHMSWIPDADPMWVMGAAPEGSANPYAVQSKTKSTFSLARDGFWNVKVNAPEDAPGSLTVQREPIHTAAQVSVLPKQAAAKRERTKLSTEAVPSAPQVLHTDRARSTLRGETVQPVRPHSAAPLTVKFLDSSGLRTLDQDVKDREKALSRASYSRSVENISSVTFTPPLSFLGGEMTSDVDSFILQSQLPADMLLAPRPKTPEEIRSAMDERQVASAYADMEEIASQLQSLGEGNSAEYELREDSLTMTMSQTASYAGSHQYAPNLLGSFTGTQFDTLDPTVVKKGLAEEEVRRLRREQRERERELELLQRAEQEAMNKRREEKLAMRELIRQEMRRKEREGMAYYRAQLELKYQHNERVRQRLNEIAAAEDADKHQRELEIQRILQQNMAKSQQKALTKQVAAQDDAQHKREQRENKLMRKEDEAMRKIAKALDREAKKALEEKERAQREASAELLAQFTTTQTDGTEGVEDTTTRLTTAEGEDEAPEDDHEEEEDHDHAEDDEHDRDSEDHEHEHDGEGEEEGEGLETGAGQETEADVVTEAPSEELTAEPSQELSEAERERLEQLADEEMRKKQSAGQKRMQEFLDKIKESTRRHAMHPRRKPKHFFLPMCFSEDISFDPFSTIDCDQDRAEEEASGDSEPAVDECDGGYTSTHPVDPFADVNTKLAEFRNEEERKRKSLFATTLQEIPAKDWIRVFRTYTVDWDAFFASQDAMAELTAAVKASDKEIVEYFHNTDPLKKITDTLSVGRDSPTGSQVNLSSTSYMSGSATLDEGVPPTVTFLPYGKILEQQKVRQGAYRYYRLEQFKQTAMLTVEVQCLSGYVDVYLAHQKLPSMSLHDRHVACTADNNGLVRLAFRPQKSGTFFISVRSHETDAVYNIWTYASSGSAERSPIIARVNSIIRKFEILATIDEEKLLELYPKYEREAMQQVHAEEAERARLEAEARLRAPPAPKIEALPDDASLLELYDIEDVNNFIQRVSKYTLMGGEARELYGDGYGDEYGEGYGDGEGDFDDDEVGFEGYEYDEQEYGQEVREMDDVVTPLLSSVPSVSDLYGDQHQHPHHPPQKHQHHHHQLHQHQHGITAPLPGVSEGLPPIHRGYSLPTLHHVRSEITLDSALAVEDTAAALRLPGIKGATPTDAPSSGLSTRRSMPRSKSSISIAREYAALDDALTKALRNKAERKIRVENPLLHQTLKPVKYQLRGNHAT